MILPAVGSCPRATIFRYNGIHVSRVSHVWVPAVTDFLLGDGQLASPARPTPAPSKFRIRSDSAFPHALGRGGVCGPGIYVPVHVEWNADVPYCLMYRCVCIMNTFERSTRVLCTLYTVLHVLVDLVP